MRVLRVLRMLRMLRMVLLMLRALRVLLMPLLLPLLLRHLLLLKTPSSMARLALFRLGDHERMCCGVRLVVARAASVLWTATADAPVPQRRGSSSGSGRV